MRYDWDKTPYGSVTHGFANWQRVRIRYCSRVGRSEPLQALRLDVEMSWRIFTGQREVGYYEYGDLLMRFTSEFDLITSPTSLKRSMTIQDGSVAQVDTRSLNVRVYDQLRQSLLQGKLKAGQSLTIRGMAKALGTSEMPVREAMKRLLAERMILQKPNRSFQVPTLEQNEFKELIDIRIKIEGLTAQRAVAKVDDELIGKLTRYNMEMNAGLKRADHETVLKSNQAFHFTIYSAAGSSILMQLIEILWMRTGPYLAEVLFNIDDAEQFVDAPGAHERLIDALLARDEEAVFEALKADLISTAHWYQEHVGMKSEVPPETSKTSLNARPDV